MKLKAGTYRESFVRGIQLPAGIVPTRSFQPMTHDQVLEQIDAGLDRAGLKPVVDDQGNTNRVFTLASEGAKMYGIMPIDLDILGPTSANSNDSIRLQLGVINSFDRSRACRIGFGSVVSVCSNGCVFAERVLGRKHTTNILSDLPDLIDAALGETHTFVTAQARFFERLKEVELADAQVNDLVVRLAQAGAIVKGEILTVIDEYHDPTHETFRQPTAWALHNAVTESAKRIQSRNGVEYAERSVRMNGVFAKEFGEGLNLGVTLN